MLSADRSDSKVKQILFIFRLAPPNMGDTSHVNRKAGVHHLEPVEELPSLMHISDFHAT